MTKSSPLPATSSCEIKSPRPDAPLLSQIDPVSGSKSDQLQSETVSDRLAELYSLIDGIGVCMLTSRRPRDGRLVSRALTLGRRVAGCDMSMVVPIGSKLCADIENDPHVNAAFYRNRTGEWVSVSGIATIRKLMDPTGMQVDPTASDISNYKSLVAETWSDEIAGWFEKDIDPLTSPDLAILVIRAISATFAATASPFTNPGLLFDLSTAAVTGLTVPTTHMHIRGLNTPDLLAARVMDSHSS